MTQTTQTATKYFNLLTEGVGYLNNPRTYEKGDVSGLTVTIKALRGKQKNDGKTEDSRFDLDVVGKEARRVIEKLMDKYPEILDFKAKKPTLFIGFTASDIRAESFTSTKGDEKKTIHAIKGRLLKVKFIHVNGEMLYKAAPVNNELIEVEDEVADTPVQENPEQTATETPSDAETPVKTPEAEQSASDNTGIDKL